MRWAVKRARGEKHLCTLPEESLFRSAGYFGPLANSPMYVANFFRIRPCNSKIYSQVSVRGQEF